MKRLKRNKFWLSAKGNLFDKNVYENTDINKYGFIALPNEYPYRIIELPIIVSKEKIKEFILNTTYLGKKIKEHQ